MVQPLALDDAVEVDADDNDDEADELDATDDSTDEALDDDDGSGVGLTCAICGATLTDTATGSLTVPDALNARTIIVC